MTAIELNSEIRCPQCRRTSIETMPVDRCLYYYECRHCGALLNPLPGDCCVFCSWGSIPCPPVQQAREAGERDD